MSHLKEQLQLLLKGRTNAVLRSHPELREQLEQHTYFLNELNPTIAQRLYHIFNDITEIPVCPNCKTKYTKFISCNQGYAPYCGTLCANSCPAKKQTTEQSWIDKYGSLENRNEHVKQTHKKVMLEKTGYQSNFHNPAFQQNFNGGKFAWDEKTRGKREHTCIERYGVKSTIESEDTKQKMKQTFEDKYQNGHPMRDSAVRQKREEDCIALYGCANPMQNDDVRKKQVNTCLQKYGVPNPAQKHIKNIDQWYDDAYILDNFINSDKTIKYREMMEFFGCNHTSGIRNRLKTLGVEYKPYTGYSKFEVEIKEFIQSIDPNINIIERNRTLIKPYEIDLFLPEYLLGIEFHGLLWHSFGYQPNNAYLEHTSKNLHKNKADLALDKGIQLLQIFENEWHDLVMQKIWKSVIKAKIGKTTKLYGRKCTIKEISNKEATQFLIHNHLQQSVVGSTANIALWHEGEIVSLMTFGKSRFTTEQYELLRFCNSLNSTVVGGFSKCLSYFIKTYKPLSMVSYANRRWSEGKVYDTNRFTLVSKIEPGYYYLHGSDTTQLKHRINFQKHKLQNILDKFNPDLTETENMYENGYRKVYDAGQLKYVKYIR